MSRKWSNDRFTPSAGCIELVCPVCEKHYWMPPSKVDRHKRCSAKCNAVRLEEIKKQRERKCETCGSVFLPRPAQLRVGHGRYCSQKCNPSHIVASNAIAKLVGEKSPKWKGGRREVYRRRKESGKIAEWRKANADFLKKKWTEYQAAHPEVGRAVKAKRRAQKIASVENHSSKDIRDLMELQKGRCAACGRGIRKDYHVDHVFALANGGGNGRRNIQLLCPKCNRAKHTKHPVEFMQEMGFLL